MQLQDDGAWRPIAYTSQALSPTEEHFAQIEKEAWGITWASECFTDYQICLEFHIETDHKPLVSLLSERNLEDLPATVQWFQMWIMRFTYSVSPVPVKSLYTADTLSQAPRLDPLTKRNCRMRLC